MAWRLAQQLPGSKTTDTYSGSKDWNERLMHPESLEKVAQQTANQAQIKQPLAVAFSGLRYSAGQKLTLNAFTEVCQGNHQGDPIIRESDHCDDK